MSKEVTIVEFIRRAFSDYHWEIKKHIKKARRYTDLYLDLGDTNLIIEIDENQHKYYKNEKKRMKYITKALGKSTIFIRFNPDEYYNCNGKFKKSCWKKENGTYILRSEEEHNNRLCNLTGIIEEIIKTQSHIPKIEAWYNIENISFSEKFSEKFLYVVHKLYYDKYDSSDNYDEVNYEICDPNSETDSEEDDDLDDDEIQSEHDTDDDYKPIYKDKSKSESEYEDDSDESESEYDFDKSASEYSESDDDCTPPPSKRRKID
jgi:hypothetical protein